ncbi:MAG: hypothetical protein DMF83_27270 [Acidobacteria bacterium]|nr:MAG: hypothetical protein DMF83_27270 [Acidobacteriota bacterium]
MSPAHMRRKPVSSPAQTFQTCPPRKRTAMRRRTATGTRTARSRTGYATLRNISSGGAGTDTTGFNVG